MRAFAGLAGMLFGWSGLVGAVGALGASQTASRRGLYLLIPAVVLVRYAMTGRVRTEG